MIRPRRSSGRLRLAASLLPLFGACAGPGRESGRDDAGADRRRTDSRPAALADAVEFTEQPARGDAFRIADHHLQGVDGRSKIAIHFDADEVRRIAAGLAPPAPGGGAVRAAEPAAESSAELLEASRQYLEQVARTEAEVLEFRRSPPADPATARAKGGEIAERIRARARLGNRLRQAAERAVREEALARGMSVEKDERGDWGADFKLLRERTLDRLYPDGKPIDGAVLAEILNGRFEEAARGLPERLRAAEAAGMVLFSVRATLLKADAGSGAPEEIEMDLPGYNDIRGGTGVAKRGAAFGVSEAEWRGLGDRLKLAGDFARLFNDARNRRSDLRRAFDELVAAFRSDAANLRDAIERLVADLPKALPASLTREGLARLGATETEIAAVLEARQAVEAVVETLTMLKNALASPAGDPEQALATVVAALGRMQATLAGLPAGLQRVGAGLAALRTLLERAVASAVESVRTEAATLLANLFPDGARELGELLAVVGRYPAALDLLRQVLPEARERLAFAETVRGDVDPGLFTPRSLDQIVDTEVSLDAYPAEPGDRVRISIELVRRKESATERLAGTRRSFVVERRGLQPHLSAHVAFVKRVDEPPGAVTETNFEAAPAASWTLHYRKEEDTPGADGWAKAFNFFDPGVGVSVAALSFEDDGAEVGVGAHLTLFGDLLQFGYGTNLNVDRDRPYYFVGIGIVELLNVAGLGGGSSAGPADN